MTGRKSAGWLALAGIFIVAAVFAIIYEPQFVEYSKLRRMIPADHSTGHLSAAPQPLRESNKNVATGTSLGYFGCRFEVPWQDKELERNEGRWAEVQFKSGQTIKLFNSTAFYVHGFINDDLVDHEAWTTALRAGFPQTKYDQLKAMLSATPEQLSPFQSGPNFARILVLLSKKGIYFEHVPLKPEIYSFERPQLRGFEVATTAPGDATHTITEATLSFFNPEDRFQMVRLRGAPGNPLTQADINRVIDTFELTDSEIAP
jgi:hypothetical protein